MRMLDLFCGRWGWSKAFAARGWECIGIDLIEPPETPNGCKFWATDVLGLRYEKRLDGIFVPGLPNFGQCVLTHIDFICASPPCEQFSVHGMKHFHPNPPYPELGIKLFEHTRRICEESGVPYVMENVRAAQKFVGSAIHHCGPFYLWGSGVPAVIPKGLTKGFRHLEMFAHDRTNRSHISATIPSELSSCVCDYAERLIEQNANLRINKG